MEFFYFIIVLTILVFVHEFGHYLVARLCKVKVLVFSIGIGPKIFSWQGKHNEWRISSIPLGGYVRMLDLREAQVSSELLNQEFTNKPHYQKILIALAGPVFNILFAILVYFALALYGIDKLKPVIFDTAPQYSFITPGSQITSVNQHPTTSFEQANDLVAKYAKNNTPLKIQLNDTKHSILSIDVTQIAKHGKELSLFDIGLYPVHYTTTIAMLERNSPAWTANLKEDDSIVKIGDTDIKTWTQLTQIIKQHPDTTLNFTIQRNNEYFTTDIHIQAINENNKTIGKIGIMPQIDTSLLKQNTYTEHYSFLSATTYAIQTSYSVVALNLTGIYQLITGKSSWHNMGSAISIAKASNSAAKEGITTFLNFLAMFSIALGVMNLLPIPMLDGGHIVIYTLEMISRKKISNQTQEKIFKIGFILLIIIMLLAVYNDIIRLTH